MGDREIDEGRWFTGSEPVQGGFAKGEPVQGGFAKGEPVQGGFTKDSPVQERHREINDTS